METACGYQERVAANHEHDDDPVGDEPVTPRILSAQEVVEKERDEAREETQQLKDALLIAVRCLKSFLLGSPPAYEQLFRGHIAWSLMSETPFLIGVFVCCSRNKVTRRSKLWSSSSWRSRTRSPSFN